MKNFILIGAGGYIAPRHLKAIKDTGNNLLAAIDKHDSVGILDSYFPDADFFTEHERLDRYLEKLKRQGVQIDYVSICSPNYLHDAHIRYGLKLGANVICEKPIVLNPWNIDSLLDLEKETGKNVYSILQLRLHPAIQALKQKVGKQKKDTKYLVNLEYITCRGHWYHSSWKGEVSKSGGVATNIGVHFFDMLTWIFGDLVNLEVREHNKFTASGILELENAIVNWVVSIDINKLPAAIVAENKRTYRILEIDGDTFEFSEGFTELHTTCYQQILEGNGFPLKDTKMAIEIVSKIRKL